MCEQGRDKMQGGQGETKLFIRAKITDWELSYGQLINFNDSRYVLGVLRGLKLIKIPDETCKYMSITGVNNYTISQSAEGHFGQKDQYSHNPLSLEWSESDEWVKDF